MSSVRVRVPATSANLGPGFDTLGLALRLYNHVTISEETGPLDSVSAEGEGSASIPDGPENIALAAARSLWQAVGAPFVPCHMHLENTIPLARGLGSSAAARAGALVAANEWSRAQGWPLADDACLIDLAARLEGHPDNSSAALLGGLVVSTLSTTVHQPAVAALCVPIAKFPRLLLFVPDSELSTATARSVLPDNVFRSDANFNLGHTALLLAALVAGEWELLREALHDRLHQEHRAVLMPGFDSVLKAAVSAGAYGATLSGAGPSILAWLPDDGAIETEVLLAMPDAAAEHEVFGRTLAVQVERQGALEL